MIGIIAKPNEAEYVEEFFQLFKTPWEFYKSNTLYDVIITTKNHDVEIDTKLLLIFNSEPTEWDATTGSSCHRDKNIKIRFNGQLLPIYTQALTFNNETDHFLLTEGTSEVIGFRRNEVGKAILRIGYDIFSEVKFLIEHGQSQENAFIPTLDLHIAFLRTLIVFSGMPVIEIPPVPADKDFIVCLTHDIDFFRIKDYFPFDSTVLGGRSLVSYLVPVNSYQLTGMRYLVSAISYWALGIYA